MKLRRTEASFLGTVLEGSFYGVYCIVFALYIKVQKKAGRNNVNYPIAALFILCSIFFPMDFTQQFITIFRGGSDQTVPWNLNLAASTLYSVIDVISQGVLIYRCWVMWGRKVLFIILPALLALTSLATALILVVELALFRDRVQDLPQWFYPMGSVSFSLSLAVNSVVTGLLILKLIMVHREVTQTMANSGVHRGYDLLPVISVLIESGMLTFIGQLVWVVLFTLQNPGFNSVGGPVTMIYGITPTIIIVRVAMGSDYGTRTHVESTIRFTANDRYAKCSNTSTSIDQKTRMHRSIDQFDDLPDKLDQDILKV